MSGFGDYKYSLEVRDSQLLHAQDNDASLSTGCLVRVYDAGSRTEATIYGDQNRTAKTNAISRSQFATDGGRIEFWSPAASVDIGVAHSSGAVARFNSVTPNDHSLVLDTACPYKMLVSQFASATSETDTGDDLPYGALIRGEDIFIEVTTVDATETIDVGLLSTETAGDADGFFNDISVATAGIVRGYVTTTGSNEEYLSGITLGTLVVGPMTVGTDLTEDTGQTIAGTHLVDGSNAVSVSYTASAGSDTGVGYICLPFTQLA